MFIPLSEGEIEDESRNLSFTGSSFIVSINMKNKLRAQLDVLLRYHYIICNVALQYISGNLTGI